MIVGRFAPSTTGEAHPGTLLAALIAWLAAKSEGGTCWLRLENLDPHRSNERLVAQMRRDLAWLGLQFDGEVLQSDLAANHGQALDHLAQRGLLYECSCSRTQIAQSGRLVAHNTRVYNNRCRMGPRLSRIQWRQASGAVRCELAHMESDPVVRRRDGSVAYSLACVADDGAMGITDIVRGRDLAHERALQHALATTLGWPKPRVRHHLLLLEPQGGKFAKMHGSLPASRLRALAPAEVWVGALALIAGLRPTDAPTTPQALVSDFDFERLHPKDRVVMLQGQKLIVLEE